MADESPTLGINADEVVACARGLRTDKGDDNPEYDRALIELTSDLIGLSKWLVKDLILGYEHPFAV